MPPLLLAIDLGEINSAYSITNIKTEELLEWSLIPIVNNSKQSNETVCTSLKKSLDRLQIIKTGLEEGPEESERNEIIIIIEFQPRVNNKTIILFGAFLMYFITEKEKNLPSNNIVTKVIGYHAGNKLLYYEPKQGDPVIRTNYASKHYANKKIAEQQCSIILKRFNNQKWIDFYEGSKKKDDLADCYLMALAYIKFEINKEVKPPNPYKKSKKSSTTKNKKKTAIVPVVPVRGPETEQKLKPGDPIPNKAGYIMGLKKVPVKASGLIGKKILKDLEGSKS